MLIGFIIVIPGGIFGIVGSSNRTKRNNRIVLSILCIIIGVLLVVLKNYIAGVLYVISGIILILIKDNKMEKYGIEELHKEIIEKKMKKEY